MKEQRPTRFNLTADDLRQYGWQAMIEQHPEKECRDFMGAFDAAAKDQETAGDDRGKRVFSFLSAIASCCGNYDSKGNPYGPMFQLVDGSRTFTPEDLTESDLAALKDILEETTDPEFRARIGDILWVCRRDYKAAQVAIRAFIESAQRFENDDVWPLFVERLRRALQLAATLGFGKALHLEIVADVVAAIARHELRPSSGALCARLMRLLLSQGQGDPAVYGALAERIARSFMGTKEWLQAEEYWEVAEHWYRKGGKESDEQRCQLEGAETLIAKAEDNLTSASPSYGFAAHWMGQGVEALRQAKADPKRIADVHTRFLDLQRSALSEMKAVDIGYDDIAGIRDAEAKAGERSQTLVRGYPFEEALRRFAFITRPTGVDELRTQVEENSKKFISTQIFGTVAVDLAGKVTDTAPPTLGESEEVYEEAIRKQMYQNAARINWPMCAVWQIEPARLTIVEEHPINQLDLSILVSNNPFIPEGHEGIYARGIQAGFYGDWLVAMHLLVPQLESSLRQVLQQHGIITSKLEADGVQDERDLGWLLTHPKMEEIFGKDITFDLRGILIERFGHNLRNVQAHGLIPEGGFYQSAVIYLWWLTIRLCWMGHLCTLQADKETEPKLQSQE